MLLINIQIEWTPIPNLIEKNIRVQIDLGNLLVPVDYDLIIEVSYFPKSNQRGLGLLAVMKNKNLNKKIIKNIFTGDVNNGREKSHSKR